MPLGYSVEESERRGTRSKNKLVADSVEAETVRLIFQLYRLGDGKSGPIGIKMIACRLNERGHRTRTGGRFWCGRSLKILINPVYIGKWTFNKRCAKTHVEKPVSEYVVVEVPAIIETPEFGAVAASLKSRDSRVAAPRVVTSPVLLTGPAVCASCGGAMTSHTGTSRSGVVHKYYACSTCARQGKAGCKGRSTPTARLDTLVSDYLIDRLFHPERLTAILTSVAGPQNQTRPRSRRPLSRS